MEEWRTDIVRGLSIGIALIVSIFLIDVGLVWLLVSRRTIHLGTFAGGLAVVLSLALIGLLAYWLYALVDSGYFLDRNQLVIHWGPNEQVIPAKSIERVLTGEELPGKVRISGGIWPGHYFGHGEVEGLGPALFYASAPPPEQVYIVTPGLTYGISPADRPEFLDALHRRLEMGPTQAVEPSSQRSRILNWRIWHDRPTQCLLGVGLLLLLGLTAYVCLIFPSLPPEVPLHFDAAGSPSRLDPRGRLFLLPMIGLFALLVNGALAIVVNRRERLAGVLLWGGALLVEVMVWVAALRIAVRL